MQKKPGFFDIGLNMLFMVRSYKKWAITCKKQSGTGPIFAAHFFKPFSCRFCLNNRADHIKWPDPISHIPPNHKQLCTFHNGFVAPLNGFHQDSKPYQTRHPLPA